MLRRPGQRYVTDVDLTARTTTGDPEGVVVEEMEPPSRAELERRLAALRGDVELPIPAASAVKIGGERAYKLARRGVQVEMPTRRSHIAALDVITYTDGAVRLDLHSARAHTSGQSRTYLADTAGRSVDSRSARSPSTKSIPSASSRPRKRSPGLIVAHNVEELSERYRTVAIGSFDGVHRGHQLVLDAARWSGRPTTVVTFWPHPRLVLGNRVELLSTLERRLELLELEGGVDEVLVVDFTPEVAGVEPAEFAETVLRRIGAHTVVVGEDFRFGRGAAGDGTLLKQLGFDVQLVPLLEGVSSTRIRSLLRQGDVIGGARLLGRPAELDGMVVLGDQRGGTLGYPTANLAVSPGPARAGLRDLRRVGPGPLRAMSIGVNPHYGGDERRIEPHLLDFEGDLYGERLVVELWRRLRDERAFASEDELVAQIASDVEETRAAERPV